MYQQDFDYSAVDTAVERVEPEPWSYSVAFGKMASGSDLSDPWQLLAAVFSFHLRPQSADEPYGPMAVFGNSRSAVPADLSPENLATLRLALAASKNAEVRARVADVLWVVTKDRTSAEVAIDAYLDSGRRREDPAQWVPSMHRYERAARLAMSLGKNSPFVKKIADLLVERVRAYKGEDPLYFTAHALDALQLLRAGDPAELLGFALVAARRARANGDGWKTRIYYEVAVRQARRTKKPDEVRNALVAIAETWVEDAERREANGDYFVAHSFWESAVQAYRKLGLKAEADGLRPRMKAAGLKARQKLKAISTEIDLSPYVDFARKAVRGLPRDDALCTFASLIQLQAPADFRAQVLKNAEQFPLTHHIPRSTMGNDGNTVAKTPGMISSDEQELETAIQNRMIDVAVQNYTLLTVGMLPPAHAVLVTEHRIDEREIAEFVTSSAFVPPDRTEFFIHGLTAGFRGDFITALHVLMPQLEHALRFILQQQGVITTSLDSEGIEEEWGLGRLLSTPELSELLTDRIVFSLRSILSEKVGPNLRNLLLHGLLTPAACKSPVGWLFWWQMLHLVVLCTPQMRDSLVRRKAAADAAATATTSDSQEPKAA